MTGTTKIIWPDCLRRSGAICKTIWQPSNKLWPSEIYGWDAETNPRIPYTCQLTYRMIAYHIRQTETLQWALHKTRSWGRYSYHKLSLFNKCSPISDDIGVCVILAKSMHSKPQVVRCTDCHRHPQFSAVHPTRLVMSLREWKINCFFFRHIWSKYAMDGYIACTNVCLRDLDGGR